MFEVTDIRLWRGHDVVDVDGGRIGALEEVYVDTASDEPVFGTVRTGLPGRHRLVFVPLRGARVAPDYLRVAYGKRHVKDAPSIDVGGELPAEDEAAVFRHYDLEYHTGASGERRLARR